MYFFSLIFVLFAYVIPGNAAAAAAAAAAAHTVTPDCGDSVIAATHHIMVSIADDKIVLKRVASLLALREALLEQVYMRALLYQQLPEDEIASTIYDVYLVDLFEEYQQLYDALPQGIQDLLQQFDELLYDCEGFSLNFALQYLVIHHAIKERGSGYSQLLIRGTEVIREARDLCTAAAATEPRLEKVAVDLDGMMMSEDALAYTRHILDTKNAYVHFHPAVERDAAIKGYVGTIAACDQEISRIKRVLVEVQKYREMPACKESMDRCTHLLSGVTTIDKTIIGHARSLIQKNKDNEKDYRCERADLKRFAAQYTRAYEFKKAHTFLYGQVMSKLSAEEKAWDCKIHKGKSLPNELFFINTVILFPSSGFKSAFARLFFLYSKIGYHGAIKSGLNRSIPGADDHLACMTFVMQHLGLTDAGKFYQEAQAVFSGKLLELEGKAGGCERAHIQAHLALCETNRAALKMQAPAIIKQALDIIKGYYKQHDREQIIAFLERDALYKWFQDKLCWEHIRPFFEGAELWNYVDPAVVMADGFSKIKPGCCHSLTYPFYHCARHYYQALTEGSEEREVLPEVSEASGVLAGQVSILAASLKAFLPSDDLRKAFAEVISLTRSKKVCVTGSRSPMSAAGGGGGGGGVSSAVACKAAVLADTESDDESCSGNDDTVMEMKVAAGAAGAVAHEAVGEFGEVITGEVITYKKFHRSHVLYEDASRIVLVQYHRSGLGRTLVIHKEQIMPHKLAIDCYSPHVEKKMCGCHVAPTLQGLCRWDRSHEFPLKVDKQCFPYGKVEQKDAETKVTMRVECYPLGYDPCSPLKQHPSFVGMLTWIVKKEAGKNVCTHRMIEPIEGVFFAGGGAGGAV